VWRREGLKWGIPEKRETEKVETQKREKKRQFN
jgi:hypothetical protein